MSVISLPVSFRPSSCEIGQERYDTMERSDSTGDESARLIAPPRHRFSLRWPDHLTLAEAGQLEAWMLKLRGSVNVALLSDPVRQSPRGGLAGTLKLVGDVAAGATSMVLTGNTSQLGTDAGDWLTIGTGVGTSHLCKSVADADGLGTGGTFTWTSFTWTSFTWVDGNYVTVTFEPPTRQAFVNGTAVTVNPAFGYFRMQGNPKSAYSIQKRNAQGGFAVDFLETFNP